MESVLVRVAAVVPRAQWGPVVQKILVDQAKGVALIPVNKSKSWFWSLGEVAVDWWD